MSVSMINVSRITIDTVRRSVIQELCNPVFNKGLFPELRMHWPSSNTRLDFLVHSRAPSRLVSHGYVAVTLGGI